MSYESNLYETRDPTLMSFGFFNSLLPDMREIQEGEKRMLGNSHLFNQDLPDVET